jgi:glutaconyl-CoA/methylmalonyl-CoA decarboxylase subunit delta
MLLFIDWAAALNLVGFSFSMVFILLVFIILVLSIFGSVVTYLEKKKNNQSQTITPPPIPTTNAGKIPQDEVYAAIAMALHDCFENIHDVESNIITIEKVNKRYTPWSSKIYGLNNFGKRA